MIEQPNEQLLDLANLPILVEAFCKNKPFGDRIEARACEHPDILL